MLLALQKYEKHLSVLSRLFLGTCNSRFFLLFQLGLFSSRPRPVPCLPLGRGRLARNHGQGVSNGLCSVALEREGSDHEREAFWFDWIWRFVTWVYLDDLLLALVLANKTWVCIEIWMHFLKLFIVFQLDLLQVTMVKMLRNVITTWIPPLHIPTWRRCTSTHRDNTRMDSLFTWINWGRGMNLSSNLATQVGQRLRELCTLGCLLLLLLLLHPTKLFRFLFCFIDSSRAWLLPRFYCSWF